MLNISLKWNSKNVIIASKIRTGSWRIKIIRYADASVVHFLFFYYLTFMSFSLSVRLHSLNSDEEPISFSHRKALHQKDILTKVVLLSHNNIDLIVKSTLLVPIFRISVSSQIFIYIVHRSLYINVNHFDSSVLDGLEHNRH